MKIFLSYSSADSRLARRLAEDLRSAGLEVWLDQWELSVGEEFVQSIEHGVDEADFVVVLLTPASVESDWVAREWSRKVHAEAESERVSVVPVRGAPCEIPDFLAGRSHADVSGGSYPLGLRHLLDLLGHHAEVDDIRLPTTGAAGAEPSEAMLPVVTPIALEVGANLIPLFTDDDRFLRELAPALRAELEAEFGIPFPGIRVRGNETDMPERSALILIEEIPEVFFEIGIDDVLVDAPVEKLAALGLRAEARADPVAGRGRARIPPSDRAAARAAGFATWDAAEYLKLALKSVVGSMAAEFVDIDIAHRLVEALAVRRPELVAETVPKAVSWFELADVLRRLLEENVSVADLEGILGALSKRDPGMRDTAALAELARAPLRRQITATFTRGRESLSVLLLDPGIEALVGNAIRTTASGSYLELPSEAAQDILAGVRATVSTSGPAAADAPILTVAGIRRYMRRLVQLEFPSMHVLSRNDLEPGVAIEPIATIRPGAEPGPPDHGRDPA